MDNAFEDVCFILEQNKIINPKELTIYEFQMKLELIEARVKEEMKQRKNKPR